MFFYFTSKALFAIKILNFYLDLLVIKQNGLIRKIRLIPNFMPNVTAWLTNNCNTLIVQYLEK